MADNEKSNAKDTSRIEKTASDGKIPNVVPGQLNQTL